MDDVCVYAYTREQAIDDGVLIDVTETGKEMGYLLPVAVTSAVWEGVVVPPKDAPAGQSKMGRLWDVLWMLRTKYSSAHTGVRMLTFDVLVANRPGFRHEMVELKAICSAGDSGEPVLTIMYRYED